MTGILIASCSPTRAPEADYRYAWSTFASGNLSQALAECSRSQSRWRDSSSAWFWKFRLLEGEVLTAQGKLRDAEALLKEPLPLSPALTGLEARRFIDLAAVKRDRKEMATECLRKSRALANEPELSVRANLVEGLIALDDRQYTSSAACFHAAAELAARHNMAYWQAQALNNQSVAARRLNLYEDAINLATRALVIADKVGARRVAAQAHGNLGTVYSYLGEEELALQHEEESVKIQRMTGDRSNLMIGLGELAAMYYRHDDQPHATANYREAYLIARELGKNRDAEQNAVNLAMVLIKAKQWDAATEWNATASSVAPATQDDDNVPYLIRNRALIAHGRLQDQESERISRELLRTETLPASLRWEIYALMGTIDAAARRFPKANGEFESARQIIDTDRSALNDPHFRMTLLSRLMPFYQDYVDARVQQNDDAGALRVAESSRARVLTELMQRDQKQQPFPDLASLQAVARSTNSGLLSFWLAPARSYAWLITASRVRRFDLPPFAEIEKLVTAYRELVEHALKDPILAKDPSGPNLWDALMREIGPAIPKGSRLIVIPDGALHRLNLETLVAPSPQPHYWIEDVEIGVAPSITIAASKPGPQATRDRSLLLIGAPEYAGSSFQPLKNAAKEVDEIEARFPVVSRKVFTGAQAAPAVYKDSNPGIFSYIHFTAHADANFQNPLGSAVILSGQSSQNRLYARDVIDIPIHADLVTISACRSAGVRSYAGEGLIGFAWAFLRAGAHHVVAGLWDVSDSSTEPLMDRFYAGMDAGRNPVSAMRNAKLALAREDARYSKPFYWGPFQVYMGSGARLGEGK